MRRWFALAVLGLVGGTAVAADDWRSKLTDKLPESKRLLLAVSEDDEIAVGKQVAANLLGVAPLVDDAELQRYVNTVGRWVALHSARPGLPWRFGVIESADLNAFAGPGGYILITRGLYANLSSEAELAGVLAHEIAHVVEKHHIEVMRQGALIEQGAKVLEKKFRDRDEKLRHLIGNGAEIFARRLDKDAEFAADRAAVVLAARAGYDPYGLPAVLQKIGAVARGDDRVALLFKTHPTPEERLRHLDAAMGERLLGLGGAAGGGLRPLMRAR